MKSPATTCLRFLIAISTCSLLVACSRDSGSGTGRLGDASSHELFDRPYIYLVRNDPNFGLRAQNYSFMPQPPKSDTEVVVQSKSEREGVSSPGSGFAEDYTLHLNKQLTIAVTVADSSGVGLIYYEYAKLPPGDYTLGTKGWPVPQSEATSGRTVGYLYFIGDKRLKARYLVGLDDKGHPTYHAPKSNPS